jgi:hypothetical protein
MNRKEKSLNTSNRTFWKIPKDERKERRYWRKENKKI